MRKPPEIRLIKNPDGPTLGYNPESGIPILEVDGKKFKNHSRSGSLEPFEDWRRSARERAEDLAGRLDTDQLLGLMLHSGMQSVPGADGPFTVATHNGVPFAESGAQAWELTDQELEWFERNNLCHMLLGPVDTVENGVNFVNAVQSLCESRPYAIPCNISTDPRHSNDNGEVFNAGGGNSMISQWPDTMGIAATFDEDLVREYGQIVSSEYRALGIATALSPQIDLATEPRWRRAGDTFGESPKLSTDLARAICDGFQTTRPGEGEETENGWGTNSIVAMVKHWPSGGPEEGGRDAHFAFGKYAVYPGDNLADHLKPFTEGAFQLSGGTEKAAAVMPYYTISWGVDEKYGENVGNSFSKYIIQDLLRDKYGYDGVVCTDWGITFDPNPTVDGFACTCWGAENISRPERFAKIIEAGVDQFGDVGELEYLQKGYALLVEAHGEAVAHQRIQASAVRILTNMFRLGLFENPYLDYGRSAAVLGCEKFVAAGLDCQRKAAILLKNRANTLPLKAGLKVYIPSAHIKESMDRFCNVIPAYDRPGLNPAIVGGRFTVVETPEEADVAFVGMRAPQTGLGYSSADREKGGNGYVPISLQYRPYTAANARAESIAGGDPREDFTNRSYRGKTVTADNEGELDALEAARRAMGGKPVIVFMHIEKAVCLHEVEPMCDALIVHHGVSESILMELAAGLFEPSGLLPHQMPRDMETVEAQLEDVPFDMDCYTDSEGHTYDFAYGMNWKGVIQDARTARYGGKNRA